MERKVTSTGWAKSLIFCDPPCRGAHHSGCPYLRLGKANTMQNGSPHRWIIWGFRISKGGPALPYLTSPHSTERFSKCTWKCSAPPSPPFKTCPLLFRHFWCDSTSTEKKHGFISNLNFALNPSEFWTLLSEIPSLQVWKKHRIRNYAIAY